jgi:branched-chain amino acid transport system substrate-binding protein
MSKSTGRIAICVMACIVLASLGGCGTKQEIVRVGAILPLSGDGAETGNQHLHGLQLAIEELNVSNPDVVFELVVDTDGGDPGAALAAFKNQLITKKILVAYAATRAACLAVVPQAENDFVPVFANTAHPFMTAIHLNAFRNAPSASLEIRTTIRFISASLKLDNAAVLYLNDDAGSDAAKAIKNEFPQAGIRIAEIQPYLADGAVIASAVILALAQNPGAVYIFGGGEATADVLGALRAAGYRGPIIGSSHFSEPAFVALAGDSREGCFYFAPTIAHAGNAAFADRYRKRFNVEPTENSIYAYDAMRIIAKAIEIKRLEKISVSNALKKVGDFGGAAGNYTYVDREWLPPVNIVKIQKGAASVVY